MLEKVELHDPSQLEIASVISGRFNQQNKELGVSGVLPTLDDNSLSVDFDSSSVAGKSNKVYPRTPSEQSDYDRQGLDYDAAKKLLDFGGLKILENPRYLPKRFVSTFFTVWILSIFLLIKFITKLINFRPFMDQLVLLWRTMKIIIMVGIQ